MIRAGGALTPSIAPWCSHTQRRRRRRQGLTLVHFSAQHKRILWDRGEFRDYLRGVSQVLAGGRGSLGCILCRKRLRLSREVDQCKPLDGGGGGGGARAGGDGRRGGHHGRAGVPADPAGADGAAGAGRGAGDGVQQQVVGGRGLHSSTSLLNLSRFCH